MSVLKLFYDFITYRIYISNLILFYYEFTQEIDDEALLRKIDFSDFEAKFKLKDKPNASGKMSRIQKMKKKSAEKITFVDSDRARNMSEFNSHKLLGLVLKTKHLNEFLSNKFWLEIIFIYFFGRMLGELQ